MLLALLTAMPQSTMNIVSSTVACWKKRALDSKQHTQSLQHDYKVVNATLNKHFVPTVKYHREIKKSGNINGNFILGKTTIRRVLRMLWHMYKLVRKNASQKRSLTLQRRSLGWLSSSLKPTTALTTSSHEFTTSHRSFLRSWRLTSADLIVCNQIGVLPFQVS